MTVAVMVVGCATLPKPDRDLFAAVGKDDANEVQRLASAGANMAKNPS